LQVRKEKNNQQVAEYLKDFEKLTTLALDVLLKKAATQLTEVTDEIIRICKEKEARGEVRLKECIDKPFVGDVLLAFERRAHILTDDLLDQAYEKAPLPLKIVINGLIKWLGSNGLELNYKSALKLSMEYELYELLKFLLGYPRLSARLIDYLNRSVSEYRKVVSPETQES